MKLVLDLLFLFIYSSTFEAKYFILRVFNGKKGGNGIMKRILKSVLVLAVVLTLVLTIGHSVQAQSTCVSSNTTCFTAGPVSPRNGFPLWVHDSLGNTYDLDVCGGPHEVDANAPFSERIGFLLKGMAEEPT